MTATNIHDFPRRPKKPNIIPAQELEGIQFQPLRYVIPGIVCEGLILLAGRLKLGKSWMTQGWAHAVAFGGIAMGSIDCEEGDVLLLALEDTPRRLQRRQRMLLGDRQPPLRLFLSTEWPRLEAGGLQQIEEWITTVEAPRLIIIDTLKMIRRSRKGNEALYDFDYSSMEPLRDLANKYQVAIVVVHHLNKRRGADDPFDLVSGSNGLAACADATLILNRDGQGISLSGRGRDLEEFEQALAFDRTSGDFRVLGDAREVQRSEQRRAILAEIHLTGAGGISPKDIAEATGLKLANVKVLLGKMVGQGEIERKGYGRYIEAGQG